MQLQWLLRSGVCGLLLSFRRQIQRCTTAHLSNYRSVPNCNLLLSAVAVIVCCNKMCNLQKAWVFEEEKSGNPNSRERGDLPQLALWKGEKGCQRTESTEDLVAVIAAAREGE